jgi:hypothetical protein
MSVPSRLIIHVHPTGQQQGPVPMQLDSNAAPLPTPPATVYTGRSFSVMSDVDAALVDPRMYLLTEGKCVIGCGMRGAALCPRLSVLPCGFTVCNWWWVWAGVIRVVSEFSNPPHQRILSRNDHCMQST